MEYGGKGGPQETYLKVRNVPAPTIPLTGLWAQGVGQGGCVSLLVDLGITLHKAAAQVFGNLLLQVIVLMTHR